MASRNGPTALGTDGTDFLHREKVASHYKASATYKSRIKAVSLLHFALALLIICRVSTSLYVMAGIRPPPFLQKLRLPIVDGWEYFWLASALAPVFALIAIKKNQVFLMRQYMMGIFLFGLLPIAYGTFENFDDFKQYWENKVATRLFVGFPWVVLEYMFFVICLQIHGFGLYFAQQLITAWTPNRGPKKTQ